MEGAGIVVEVGSAVRGLEPGELVILPHDLGTWREACAVAAEKLVVGPGGDRTGPGSDVESESGHRLANAA